MTAVRLHPRVYDDIDDALAQKREQFGPRQVGLYARLISKGRQTLRKHPTIGQLREDLGPGINVYCIAAGRIKAPHGYVYRVHEDGTIHIARLVHLVRYLPELPHGNSEEDHAGESRFWDADVWTLQTQKRGVSFRQLRVFLLCCAGAIRPMYHELSAAFRVRIAA